MKREDVQESLRLAKAARNAYRSLLQRHKGRQSRLPLFENNEGEVLWYERMPSLMDRIEAGVDEWAIRIDELQTDNNRQAESLRTNKANSNQLQAEMKQATDSLKATTGERDQLKQLNDELKELKTELERQLKEYNHKQAEFTQVLQLADYLRQGQYSFFDRHKEPAYAATVSSLINHSLFQLSRTIFERDKKQPDQADNGQNRDQRGIRKNALLSNIYVISKRLEKLDGSEVQGFGDVLVKLNKYYTEAGAFQQETAPADSRPFDAEMFQSLIKFMRDYMRLELGPFYFDVDEQGRVHRAG